MAAIPYPTTMRTFKIWDSADGAATAGRAFTASIAQEVVPKVGDQLDFLKLGIKGAVSTAAVVIETFADIIAPFTLRKGAQNRVILNLDELCALMAFYYDEVPTIGENTDATGNDFIGGLKIPVYDKFDDAAQFLVQADYATQTNIATETIALYGHSDTGEQGRAPIHAVRIPHTTSATAGIEQLSSQIVNEGTLLGIIIETPNGFADGNTDTSIEKLKIYEEGKTVAEFNDLASVSFPTVIDYVTPTPMADLLRKFRMYDLRPAGLDTSKKLTLGLDIQDVSDAIVIIPVIAKK